MVPLLKLLGRFRVAEGSTDGSREPARLDAKRKHLRGLLAKNQRELRRAWTDFRNLSDAAAKRTLRRKIANLEDERKDLVKRMLKVQVEMRRLGFEPRAGEVHD